MQVPYNITGWLEKNKDPLNDTVVDQFKKGSNALIQTIFADHPGQSGAPGGDAGGKGKTQQASTITVSCKIVLISITEVVFIEQLFQLLLSLIDDTD